MATKLVPTREFGRFGQTVEDARKSEFFRWFHLEETGREKRDGLIIRFQPAGAKFHDLAVVSLETEDGFIRAATLRLMRSFINGPDEAFARDIAASFLRTSLPFADANQASNLMHQISNDYRGSTAAQLTYEVFIGQSVYASESFEHMDLHLINSHAGGDHLMIRIDLARPARKASPCGSRR